MQVAREVGVYIDNNRPLVDKEAQTDASVAVFASGHVDIRFAGKQPQGAAPAAAAPGDAVVAGSAVFGMQAELAAPAADAVAVAGSPVSGLQAELAAPAADAVAAAGSPVSGLQAELAAPSADALAAAGSPAFMPQSCCTLHVAQVADAPLVGPAQAALGQSAASPDLNAAPSTDAAATGLKHAPPGQSPVGPDAADYEAAVHLSTEEADAAPIKGKETQASTCAEAQMGERAATHAGDEAADATPMMGTDTCTGTSAEALAGEIAAAHVGMAAADAALLEGEDPQGGTLAEATTENSIIAHVSEVAATVPMDSTDTVLDACMEWMSGKSHTCEGAEAANAAPPVDVCKQADTAVEWAVGKSDAVHVDGEAAKDEPNEGKNAQPGLSVVDGNKALCPNAQWLSTAPLQEQALQKSIRAFRPASTGAAAPLNTQHASAPGPPQHPGARPTSGSKCFYPAQPPEGMERSGAAAVAGSGGADGCGTGVGYDKSDCTHHIAPSVITLPPLLCARPA